MTDMLTSTTQARWWFDALAVIKATAASTNGRLALVEVTEPPGAEAPLHVHHREEEGFYVLDGSVTITVGDETTELAPGDFAFGPRDIPHRYTVGPDGCRMLALARRGAKHAAHAAERCPSLAAKTITPHVLRHTAAMRLLHAGVDTTVIALWLGHEQVETTQMYLHADLALKERALARTKPLNSKPGRYRPPDALLRFLDGL